MPRYSILRCSDQVAGTGHTVQGPRNVGIVYRVNDVCYKILGILPGSNPQAGDVSLDAVQQSFSGPDACSQCTWTAPTVPLAPNSGWRYNLTPCTPGLPSLTAYRNTTQNTVPFGARMVYNNQCYQVTTIGQQGTLSGVNITNVTQFYPDCNCQLPADPPAPPPPSTNPWIYPLITCPGGVPGIASAAYHNSDGSLSNRNIIYNAQCFRLGQPFQQGAIPFNAINITGQATYPSCTCTNPPPPPGPPGANPTRYVFQRCNGVQTVIGYRNQGDLTIGSSIIINGNCHTVTSIFGSLLDSQGNSGVNLSSAPTCTCPSSGGGGGGTGGGGTPIAGGQGLGTAGGPPPSALPFGYACTLQGCVQIFYDPDAGDDPPEYATQLQCQSNCQSVGTNGGGTTGTLLPGFACVGGVCQLIYYDPAAGDPPYYTSLECEANCGGSPPPPTPGPNVLNPTPPPPVVGGFNCISGNCVYTTGLATYATELDCINDGCSFIYVPPPSVTNWNCVNGQCQEVQGSGEYQSFAECDAACNTGEPPPPPSGWNCNGNGGCFRSTSGIGTYATEAECNAACTITGTPTPPEPPPGCNDPEPTVGTSVAYQLSYTNPTITNQTVLNLIPECWKWKYTLCTRPFKHRGTGSLAPPLKSTANRANTNVLIHDLIQRVEYSLTYTSAIPSTQRYSGDSNEWDIFICLKQTDVIPDPDIQDPVFDYPAAGQLLSTQCRGNDLFGIYTNGGGGTYEQEIEKNSTTCVQNPPPPSPSCPPKDSPVPNSGYCVGYTRYMQYYTGQLVDSQCTKYDKVLEINSAACGWLPPPPPPPPPPTPVDPPVKPVSSAKVYIPIDRTDQFDTVDKITFPLWTNNQPRLTTPTTSSLQHTSSFNYIMDVYNVSPNTNVCREIQYKIIYADYEGKGDKDLGGRDHETLTKAMYTQYAHVLLPHGQTKFNFGLGDEDYVYIIDIQRDRFKQTLDPGNWQLTIASCSFSKDVNANSILQNMWTASYGNDFVTMVDGLTRTNSYIVNKPAPVVYGTIETGPEFVYITSSLTSGSTAPDTNLYVTSSNTDTVETVVIRGSQGRAWEFTNVSGTVSYQYADEPYAGATTRELTGTFTASFTGGTTSYFDVIPNPLYPKILDTFSGVVTGTSEGYLDIATGEIHVYNLKNFSYIYTSESINYAGTFKGLFFNSNKTGEQALQEGAPSKANRIGTSLNASFSGPGIAKFFFDFWGDSPYIADNLDKKKYTNLTSGSSGTGDGKIGIQLPNGNVLYTILPEANGAVYPNHGIIVLSGKKLDQLGFNTNRSIEKNGYNTYRLFHSMKLVLAENLTDLSGDPLGFYGRGVNIERNKLCFIRTLSKELNFSNNPTYVSGSEGEIIEPLLYKDRSYFTSIGLYNPNWDLLAVGKISKPVASSRTDQGLFTVKVTYI